MFFTGDFESCFCLDSASDFGSRQLQERLIRKDKSDAKCRVSNSFQLDPIVCSHVMIPKSGVLSLFLRVLVHTMDSICQSADPPPSGSKRERMGTVGALKKIVGGGAATVSTPKLVCRMRQEQKWPWC